MADRAKNKQTKHLHVMLPFAEWARLKKRLTDEDKRLTHFVRELIIAELDGAPASTLTAK
jgi:hypothetical protein